MYSTECQMQFPQKGGPPEEGCKNQEGTDALRHGPRAVQGPLLVRFKYYTFEMRAVQTSLTGEKGRT